MSKSRIHFDFDEFQTVNFGRYDSGISLAKSPSHLFSLSPSSMKSNTSKNSDEIIDKQICSIISSCDVLSDNLKKLKEKPKTRDRGCQTDDSGFDPLQMEGCRNLMHKLDEIKHGYEHYKEKCEEQAAIIAEQNRVLRGQEEIVQELTNMFNQKLDQLRNDFCKKAKTFVGTNIPQKTTEVDQIRFENEISYLQAQNDQLRKNLKMPTSSSSSCNNSFDSAFIDCTSIKSSPKSREKEKWQNRFLNVCQNFKRTKSFRRRSD
uniref:Uncharacterized protein n=1 Tax=Panagrolaimus davidi TaxID=227884 RepID=A0A914Q6G8_9BILA